MIRRPVSRKTRIVLGVSGVLVLAAIYTVISYRQYQENPTNTTVPTWGKLADGLKRTVTPQRGEVWLLEDGFWTCLRLGAALGISAVVSLIIGLLVGCYPLVEALLSPPVIFLGKIPPTAMLAVFFVTFHFGFTMNVSIIVFGVLPSLILTVYLAAKYDVPDELVNKAYTLGASQVETIWNVVYKHILPKFLDGIRLSIGPAMVFLIAAEYAVEDVGFGYRIRIHEKKLDMAVVFIYCIYLGCVGLVLDMGLKWLRRALCPWYSE